jgi:hypothetical protein
MVVSADMAHTIFLGIAKGAGVLPEEEGKRLGRLVSNFTQNGAVPADPLKAFAQFVSLPPQASADELVKSAVGAVDDLVSFVGHVLSVQAKHFNLSDAKHMLSPEAHSNWVANLTGATSTSTHKALQTPLLNVFTKVNTQVGGFHPLGFMQVQAAKGELSKEALTQALAQHIEANKLPLAAVEGKPGHFALTGDAAKKSAFTLIAHHNGIGTVANGRYAAYLHNPWEANNPVHYTTVVSDAGNLFKNYGATNRLSLMANELTLAKRHLTPSAPKAIPLETLKEKLPQIQEILDKQKISGDSDATVTAEVAASLVKEYLDHQADPGGAAAWLKELTTPQPNVEGYLNDFRLSKMPKPVKALVEQHLTTETPDPKAFVQGVDALVAEEAGKINVHNKQPLNYWAVTNSPHYYGAPEQNILAKLTGQVLPHVSQVNELSQAMAKQLALMPNPHATMADTLLPINGLVDKLITPENVPSMLNPNVLNFDAVGQPASALHNALHEATGLDLAKLAVANADTGLVNVDATSQALDTAITEGTLPNWQRLEQFPNRYQHTHPETGEVTHHVGVGPSIGVNPLKDGKGWTHLVLNPVAEGEAASNETWQVLDPFAMGEAVESKFEALGKAFNNAPPEAWQAAVIKKVSDVVKRDNSLFDAFKVAAYTDNLKTSGLNAVEQVVQTIPEKTMDNLKLATNLLLKLKANQFKGATTFAQVREMMTTKQGDEALAKEGVDLLKQRLSQFKADGGVVPSPKTDPEGFKQLLNDLVDPQSPPLDAPKA